MVSVSSEKYGGCFGFTEEEVFAALDAQGLPDRKQEVKRWYSGFTFGSKKDIYNPWSIINYLDKKRLGAYWANTSSNSLAGKLIREGSGEIKMEMEELLSGGTLTAEIDEQFVYSQLPKNRNAIWSLLLASGYLKLSGRYVLTSNRESGFGRYDVMLEPRKPADDGIILEFKVFQPRKEKSLEDTVEAALMQIEEKKYEAALTGKGIPGEKIRKYGFAF